MSAALLIATHMNVPYGRIVSVQDVVASLRAGRMSAATKEANEILAALFIENAPDLILRCADEEGVSITTVRQLYQDTLARGLMPVLAWEEATRALMPHERKDRSLLLHQEAVRMIQAEPVLADRALAILERWAQQGTGPTQLLRARLSEMIKNRDWAAVLEESERGRQLRQASPMPCLVPNEVRLRILRSLKDTGKPAGLDSLQEKYPLLFSRTGPRGGPGWVELLDALCAKLQAHADAGGQQPRALCAREEWGRLDLRFVDLDPQLEGLVAAAGEKSLAICDVCGAPGEPVPELWHRTRCEQHRNTRPWWLTSQF